MENNLFEEKEIPISENKVSKDKNDLMPIENVGLTAGYILNFIFLLEPGYTKMFALPFINLAVFSILSKIYVYLKLKIGQEEEL